MGLLDSIFGGDEKPAESGASDKSSNPFSVNLSFSQLRMSANKRNSVNLMVKVKNVSGATQLVSVDAMLPKDSMLGFDQASINKAVEKRVGELKAGQSLEVPVEIWATNQTKPGNYSVDVTVFSHYIGYDKVISYIKKNIPLRVV